MIGLSYDEMMFGEITFIEHRFAGWAIKYRHENLERWRQTRTIAFTIAKSAGATKARDESSFMKLNEPQKKSTLTPEIIEQLKKRLD